MWKHSMLSNLVLLQCISILFSWCLSNVTQINVFSAKSNLKQGKWKTNWNNLFGRATWCSSGCSKQDLSAAFWNWKVACLTLMKVYNHWILWSWPYILQLNKLLIKRWYFIYMMQTYSWLLLNLGYNVYTGSPWCHGYVTHTPTHPPHTLVLLLFYGLT